MAIRLDKVKSTAHLVNFVFGTDLGNGTVVGLGALRADGEAYDAAAITDVATSRIVLHASVPMQYEADALESAYVLKAGKVGRGYVPEQGDIVTITDDMITGTTVVGQLVIPVNTATKLSASATSTTERVVGRVIAKETLGGAAATVIEFVKAV